jgi:hypothetical protein
VSGLTRSELDVMRSQSGERYRFIFEADGVERGARLSRR